MNTELTYRRTYASGASIIGSMIALFDTLVGDLRRAADAMKANDIETRCREINHALLVMAHLQDLLDMENGGQSALLLESFYERLRLRLSEASIQKSASILEDQIGHILQVRTAWQQLDSMPIAEAEQPQQEPGGRYEQEASSSEIPARLSLSI